MITEKDLRKMKVKRVKPKLRLSDLISEGFELTKKKLKITEDSSNVTNTYDDTDYLEQLVFS